MASEKVDERREAGKRTRARLLDAALDLLAERGEDAVSLREITSAAEANVAAVSYHFGSLKALCDAAVEQGLVSYLDAQQRAVATLTPDSTLEEVAAAFAQPMIKAMGAGGRDLAVIRIVARCAIDPPQGWRRFDASFDRIRGDVVRVLRRRLPNVKEPELIFRTRCAAGLINWLILAPVGAELRGRPPRQIEKLLIPVLAGTFRATPRS